MGGKCDNEDERQMVIKLIQDLVRIRSVNGKDSETGVVARVQQEAAVLGMACEVM
jgi:acetylornithine deacetylase/succinyl-diaminopimelate desuccinylase-like protein